VQLIASVVAGGQALGVLGMVIAVPIATVLQETIRLWLEHRRALASYLHPVEEAGPTYFVS
jgi:predicted PurR-regulated permease PerM